MSLFLVPHIAAGAAAILTGAGALCARKGSKIHRVLGKWFSGSMIFAATIAIYLALFSRPPAGTVTPPQASVSVAVLTWYFIGTAWTTVRRRQNSIGNSEYVGLFTALTITAAMLAFGIHASSTATSASAYAPYFLFSGFAAYGAALDLRMITAGGVSGPSRVARHLWRMCFALFFATSFFFLGQQKVMPVSLQGSPLLIALSVAPLAAMVFWLVRIWATRTNARRSEAGLPPSVLTRLAFRAREAPCPS